GVSAAAADVRLEPSHLDVVLPFEMDDVRAQRLHVVVVVTVGDLREEEHLLVLALRTGVGGAHRARSLNRQPGFGNGGPGPGPISSRAGAGWSTPGGRATVAAALPMLSPLYASLVRPLDEDWRASIDRIAAAHRWPTTAE